MQNIWTALTTTDSTGAEKTAESLQVQNPVTLILEENKKKTTWSLCLWRAKAGGDYDYETMTSDSHRIVSLDDYIILGKANTSAYFKIGDLRRPGVHYREILFQGEIGIRSFSIDSDAAHPTITVSRATLQLNISVINQSTTNITAMTCSGKNLVKARLVPAKSFVVLDLFGLYTNLGNIAVDLNQLRRSHTTLIDGLRFRVKADGIHITDQW